MNKKDLFVEEDDNNLYKSKEYTFNNENNDS